MNRNSPFTIHNSSGFSTLELLIAVAILVTAISGSVLVVFGGNVSNGSNPIVFQNQTISLDNQVNNEAIAKANDLIENARASASLDFNSVAGVSSYDFFDQELTITDVNPCKKTGVASISWSIEQNRSQVINLETTFTNIDEALALGGDCGPNSPPATEWWFPFTFEDYDLKSIDPSTKQSNNAGVGATSIDVVEKNGSKYAVITTNHSSEKDLWTINVDDGHNAFISGSVETSSIGLNNADVAGNLVFAITAGSYNTQPSMFQVISISTIDTPSIVATKSLSISGANAANDPNARAIYYYDGKVYVGTHKTGGREFQIFDAASPFNLLGSLEVNHNVNDIIVRGDYAYLATSDNDGEVMVIDISDPTNLQHPDITGMKLGLAGDYDGAAIFLLNNKLYLGREKASENNDSTNHNFHILNIEVPTAMYSLGSKKITRNPTQVLDVTAIQVVDSFAFLGTSDSNAEFQVFRVDNPSNIYNCNEAPPPGYSFPPEGCGKYDFPQKITDLEFHDDLIYASIENNATFRIVFDDASQY